MSGVTWDEKSDSDWLASNGRWYPHRLYPKWWSTSALPPAPGHDGAASILQRAASIVSDGPAAVRPWGDTASGSERTRSSDAAPSAGAGSSPNKSRISAEERGRATATDRSFLPKEPYRHQVAAEAEVVDQRTYAHRIDAGAPKASALPPAPGRIRDVDDDGDPDPPPPPAALPPPPQVIRRSPTSAGDDPVEEFGRMFGAAKERIAKAINEAAEAGK